MKQSRRAVAAGVAVLGLISVASPAWATPPPNTGFDDQPDVVVGGGSDTTYLVSGDLTLLYNRSPGCPLVTDKADPNKGKCIPAAAPGAGPFADWDHDAFVEATPVGSSSGITALQAAGPQYNPPIDYARSSRGPSGAELTELTFWGYAQDGIAAYSFGTRTPGNFVQGIDLYNIFNCTTTNWDQIPGYTGPAGPIFPYGINPSSGTYASFRDYLRTVSGNATFDPNAQACVRKVAGADGINGTADDVFAFENDLKIQLSDKGPDNIAGTADDDPNAKFTWSSASILGFPFLRQSGSPWSITGVAPDPGSIFAQTYPINRTVNHVTRNTAADLGVNGDVIGATGGKPGAVREFTRFLCRVNNAAHPIDPVTGLGYKSEINSIIGRNGFTQVPTALRTAGSACRVQT